MKLAPITLFVYNRPEHAKKTIEALKKNKFAKESELFIFSDGPKKQEDTFKVKEVREYLKTISGFKSMKIVERQENLGLAKSIIGGVTEVVNRYGRIIVLEDDLITSPYFLKYMNEALDLYENEEKIISIHGYVYPIKQKLPETFLLKGADCWGWATWKRGWDLFETDGRKLLAELKERKLTKEFDFDNSYPYTQMLEGQINGFNNSWAVCWYASAFLKEKLTLYPGESLIRNYGFDNSGTHSGNNKYFDTKISNDPVILESINIDEDQKAKDLIKEYFNLPKIKIITIFMRLKFYFNILFKKYGQ